MIWLYGQPLLAIPAIEGKTTGKNKKPVL